MRRESVLALERIQSNFTNLSDQIQPMWHPLGFVSCVVFEENQIVNRLHYWPRMERRPKSPNWPIHSHVFNLSSLVVHGSITDIQYNCSLGSRYSTLEVKYFGDNSRLELNDQQFDIYPVRETKLEAHGFYSVEKSVFHESVVEFEQETLTLACCTNHSESPPIVLAPSDETFMIGGQIHEYVREKFDKHQFWIRIRYLIENFFEKEN